MAASFVFDLQKHMYDLFYLFFRLLLVSALPLNARAPPLTAADKATSRISMGAGSPLH
jgi:hypothetical protein